ncbi:hypothetical protein GGR58DRAFT_499870 [Xylaria digitata]|nr:hypothetical protein GGR58DRAFT_499870 [Xylaria digitata]
MPFSLGGIQVVVVIFILTPFSIAALGLRLWSRSIKNASLAFNDYMAILALIFAIAENAFAGVLGVHVSDIVATNPSLLQLYSKLTVPGVILWAAANTCVRLSILSLYTILFPNRRFRYICYGAVAISVGFFIVVFLEAFLLCTPVEFNWDKSIPGGVCNQSTAFFVSGILNLIIDAFIVVLPMPMLFKLQLPLFKKLGIVVMFSLGAVICIISLFRIISLQEWNLEDATFGSPQVSIYSAVEPTLGVINACLPTIKPALYKLSGRGVYGVPESDLKDNRKSDSDKNQQNPIVLGRNSSRFRHFEDEIPLTSIRTDNQV